MKNNFMHLTTLLLITDAEFIVTFMSNTIFLTNLNAPLIQTFEGVRRGTAFLKVVVKCLLSEPKYIYKNLNPLRKYKREEERNRGL